MRGSTGENTELGIKEAALHEFAAKGYELASFEHIARELGVSPSAIQQHFASKAQLLDEIIAPFEARLDEVVLAPYLDATVPLSATERRDFLAALLAAHCEHREVLILLLREVPSHWPVFVNPRMSERVERFVQLLAGDQPTRDHRVVVNATLGVLTRPLIDSTTAIDDEHTRRLILAMALDVAKRLGNEASRSWSGRRRSPESGARSANP